MDRDDESGQRGYSGLSYVQTLEAGLLPSYQPGHIFVQDNAPIHRALVVESFIERHGIWTLEWPAYSPDLNPIEHVWWALKKLVYKLHPELKRMGRSAAAWEALHAALQEAWVAIPDSLIRNLIYSMPRRLEAVRKAKGWQTKY